MVLLWLLLLSSWGKLRALGPGFVAGQSTRSSGFIEGSFDVVTCNASCWPSFKLTMPSRVLLGQEVATLSSSVDSHSRWLSSCGLHSFWAPSRRTDKGGVSGGAVVAVDSNLHPFAIDLDRLSLGSAVVVIPHRLACALVPMGKLGIVACYSFYGLTGVGLNHVNMGFLNALGMHIKGHGYPWLVGGDFNFTLWLWSNRILFVVWVDRSSAQSILHALLVYRCPTLICSWWTRACHTLSHLLAPCRRPAGLICRYVFRWTLLSLWMSWCMPEVLRPLQSTGLLAHFSDLMSRNRCLISSIWILYLSRWILLLTTMADTHPPWAFAGVRCKKA